MSRGKKILRLFGILLVAICFAGVIMLTSFNSKTQINSVCENMHVNINHDQNLFFVDEADIKNMLIKFFEDLHSAI